MKSLSIIKYSIIGYLLLLLGILLFVIVQFELFTFYQFSVGGKFHFEGFGFGSFMFGFITLQVVMYSFIGTIFIIIGYGHIKHYSWTPPITIAFLISWEIVGLPISIIFVFALLASKNVSLVLIYTSIVLVLIFYFIAPYILIRIYRNPQISRNFSKVSGVFAKTEISSNTYSSIIICIFFMIINTTLILYNCIFPFWGQIQTEKNGLYHIIVNNLMLTFLCWGTMKKYKYINLLSIIYYGQLIISIVLTFIFIDFKHLLMYFEFPEYENRFLNGIPLSGLHIILILSIPILIEILNRSYQISKLQKRSKIEY